MTYFLKHHAGSDIAVGFCLESSSTLTTVGCHDSLSLSLVIVLDTQGGTGGLAKLRWSGFEGKVKGPVKDKTVESCDD